MSESDSNSLLGAVVVSKAGRDRNRAFLVVGIADEEYVLLADGCLRKLERPKKKKRKHIRVEPAVVESVRTKILEGKQVFDAEIRNCLLNLGYKLE
ncbi:KOW domain-containing RNA-binding protein [Christensenellaceae bacterium OttesenSCG-928-L17]|nr:KOW domain-containing RNA-binding protein [Christensenellaceae bacterium OttesenSCG-928-L17]